MAARVVETLERLRADRDKVEACIAQTRERGRVTGEELLSWYRLLRTIEQDYAALCRQLRQRPRASR